MADEIQSNIKVNIDTSAALASIKQLQTQISAFHTQMSKGGAQAAAEARNLQQNLINSINATNKFAASMTTVKSSAEQFTDSLEKNKLSLGEYFRYAGASSRSFGRFFKTEFETINKVARERVKDLQTQYIKLGRDANGAMRAIKVRPLILDMENLSTKTQIAAQRQQLLNQLLKQGSTNLLNFGKNTQWAGRQLMVGFTVPLTMAGTAAAKSFMEMEKAAIKFKRVYGDMFTTTEETNKVFNDIKKIAMEFTKFGLTVQDTMDMAATAAATGATGAKLLAQVTQANKLATLGAIDQQQALQTTISLVDAFGISAEDLTKKIDFLNAVENQTITSIEDLTIAIPKAAPVVRQLGGDVEDLTFFLTAMKEGGVNASEGANALKSGLASLINPTAKTSAMMKQMGIDINAIVEKDQGNLKQTVLNFASALDTLDPLNRARAIEQMFGKFQFSRLSTLFKNVADENSQANRVMELAARTPQQLAYISQKEMEKMQESTMYKFQESIAKLQAAMAPIGEQFMKVVTPIIDGITKILNAFNNLPDSVKNFAMILVAGVGGLGPVLLMTFGLIANGVANLIKLFANLKDFFNRTGKSSLDLGSQTKYMTTKQIEAAAVGASLEQVHSKLQQRFTVEAKAVDQLTAAYGRSIAAQRAFMGPIVSSDGTKRKAFAKGGIVRGPGTGTSDSIPAMLSNGEAVIPAKQTAKYSGLIQNMIMDNLPRFAAGGVVNTAMANARSLFQLFGGKAAANRTPTLAFKMRSDALGQFIQEGQYKSLFHGVRSSARDTQSQRALIEKATMGVPVGSGAAQRPVYGFLTSKEMVPTYYGTLYQGGTPTQLKKDSFGTHDPLTPEQRIEEQFLRLINPQSVALSKYGENTVFLKPEALARASISFGDTLTIWEQALKLGKKVPLVRKLFQTNKSSLAKTLKASKSIYKDSKMGAIPYIEAHLPGGFSIQDVERIGISNDFPERTAAKIVEVQKLLKENGLENISVFDLGKSSIELGKMFTSKHNYLANGGIISGPGSGTSDSILAMVSNGEAIIPAKQAKKYSGLVNGMISGNLPGFKDGKYGDVSKYNALFPGFGEIIGASQSTNNELVKVMKTLADTTYEIAGRGAAASSNTGVNAAHGNPRIDLTAEQARRLGLEMEAAGGSSTASRGLLRATGKTSAYSNLTFPLPRGANLGAISGTDLSRFVGEDSGRFMSMIAANSKMDQNDPGFKEFANRVSSMMAQAGARAISESDFENIIAKSIEQQSEGAAKQALVKSRDTYQTFNVASREGGRLRRESAKFGFGMDAEGALLTDTGQTGYKRIRGRLASSGLWKKYGEEANIFTKDVVSKMIQDVKNGIISGVKKATKIASPSKEGEAVGANIGGSIVSGAKKKTKDAVVVGEQLAAATNSGVRNGIAASSGTKYIPGMFATDFDGQGGILQGPRQGTRLERFRANFGSIMRNRFGTPIMSGISGGFGISSGVASLGGRIANIGRTGGMAGMGASMGLGMLSGILPGAAGQAAGAASGVAGMVSMLSMFPNFSAGLGGAIAALAPFAPAIVGVTGGLALLKFGVDEYFKAQNKAKSELEGIANVANFTANELKGLGDTYGFVPTNQYSYGEISGEASGFQKPSEYTQSLNISSSESFKERYLTPEKEGALTRLEKIQKSKNPVQAFAKIANAIVGAGGDAANAQAEIDALKFADTTGKLSGVKFDVNDYLLGTKTGSKKSSLMLQSQILQNSKKIGSDTKRNTFIQNMQFQEQRMNDLIAQSKVAKTRDEKERLLGEASMIRNTRLPQMRKTLATGKDELGMNIISEGGLQAAKTAGADIRDTFKSASEQLRNGAISSEKYKAAMNSISSALSKVKGNSAMMMLNQAISDLPNKTKSAISGLKDMNDQLLLARAAFLGVNLNLTPKQLAALNTGLNKDATKAQKTAREAVLEIIRKALAGAETDIKTDLEEKKPKATAQDIRAKKQERLSAAMALMAKEEDKINKKYDERLKKLDEIQKANDKIAQQQRGQLDLADALSRGDISAAAGIVTGIRAQNAQSALEEQRAGINAAREAELASATINVGGKKYKKQDLQEMLNALEYADLTKVLGSGSFAGYAKRGFAKGGLVSYFAFGGAARGTDIVPAMLTPGEFVIKKSAVDRIGAAKLGSINNGASIGDSVYNYSINVNVRSDSNPDTIAQAVLTQIRRIDNMRVRGNTI